MNAREIAYRVFAGELAGSSLETRGDDEASPSYLVTPLGLMVNRVFVAGKLTEKTNKGTEEEPSWNAVVKDVSGSNFYIQAGRFQPEAATSLAAIDADEQPLVGVIAKIRTWTSEDGKMYINLRPEHISVIDAETYGKWIVEAAEDLWRRLNLVRTALSFPEASVQELQSKGLTHAEADGITRALDHYESPESQRYMRILLSALRRVLPGRDIDFGIPEDADDYVAETKTSAPKSAEPAETGGMDVFDKKDFILGLVEEYDTGSKGAPRNDIERRAEEEGISADEVESLLDDLMNDGQIYEPNLGYMRKI